MLRENVTSTSRMFELSSDRPPAVDWEFCSKVDL